MVLSKYWGEINPPAAPNLKHEIRETHIKKKSGLVIVHESILVLFRPVVPVETIELTFTITPESTDES